MSTAFHRDATAAELLVVGVLIWCAFAGATAYLGHAYRKSAITGLALGILLGPYAFLHALFLRRPKILARASIPDRRLTPRELSNLQDLAALGDRAVLSEPEYVSQRDAVFAAMHAGPSAARLGLQALAIVLTVSFVSLLWLYQRVSHIAITSSLPPTLPKCENPSTLRQVIATYADSAASRLSGLTIVSIDDVYQSSWTASETNCRGNARLSNATSRRVAIRFFIRNNEIVVQTYLLDPN